MTASLALVAYAAVIGTLGAYLLRRAAWPQHAPRLGVLTWQALSASVLLAVVLAGLALAVPLAPFTFDLAMLLDTCVMLLRAQYATPGGALAGLAGTALALGVLSRAGYSLVSAAWTARCGRARQRKQLALVAHHDHALDALVLEHSTRAAYCVPGRSGRSGRVVLTSAALRMLDAEQLAAVLDHERAHLRGRHDLVVLGAESLRTAFPFVPAFSYAAEEIGRLTEMVADDTATRGRDRFDLATALVQLADGAAPAGALGAGGSTALTRVRRLAAPAKPLGAWSSLAALTGVVVLMLAPLALTAVPALAVASSDYCPISMAPSG